MAEKSTQPVVIKKVVKGGGHHGGSWKVAYADFVTAMMAFFLLMWLLASANQEQKAAISEYFKNPSAEIGTSPKPGPSGAEGPGGASTGVIDMGGGAPLAAEQSGVSDSVETTSEESTEQQAEKRFRDRIAEMLEELRELATRNEVLKQYQDQLLFDITTEGLRIQVLDKDNRPMFDVGSAALKPHTHEILREIAKVINAIPAPVSHFSSRNIPDAPRTAPTTKRRTFHSRWPAARFERSKNRLTSRPPPGCGPGTRVRLSCTRRSCAPRRSPAHPARSPRRSPGPRARRGAP